MSRVLRDAGLCRLVLSPCVVGPATAGLTAHGERPPLAGGRHPCCYVRLDAWGVTRVRAIADNWPPASRKSFRQSATTGGACPKYHELIGGLAAAEEAAEGLKARGSVVLSRPLV